MPSTYAHYRMGQEVYHNLTGKPKQIIEKYKELYDIGLHGPDILFITNRSLQIRSIRSDMRCTTVRALNFSGRHPW